MQVLLDGRVAEFAEHHPHRRQVALDETGGLADDSHRGLEHQRLAAHPAQLGRGARVVAGLAERLARQLGHLVRADDHGFGKAGGHGARFFERQPLGQLARRFTVQRRFVDFRRLYIEGQVQAV